MTQICSSKPFSINRSVSTLSRNFEPGRRASSRLKLPPIEKERLYNRSQTIGEENLEESVRPVRKDYETQGIHGMVPDSKALNEVLDTYI